jgi:hypothetical protein
MSAPNVEWFLLGCDADCSDVDEESNPAAQKTKKVFFATITLHVC